MITSREFGTLPDGEKVIAYDFVTEDGFQATILSYGATLQSLTFPDGTDIVLGFDTLENYLGEHPYFGSIIGRVANRISGASFEIDGKRYKLPANEGPNNLHAGPEGFERVNWFGEVKGETLILRHTSPDGHQGFPGELMTELSFTFNGAKLMLNIRAATDKPCPVNITYHPYFNLTDGGATPATDHKLQINASFYTPTDADNLPTGQISSASSNEDYRYSEPRGIEPSSKLDQNFVIKDVENDKKSEMAKVAKLSSVTTGHKVIICSTQRCIQAYTGEHIPEMIGKSGTQYGPHHGIALEPQGYPDAINHKAFPSNILQPGELYNQTISYTFRPGAAQA